MALEFTVKPLPVPSNGLRVAFWPGRVCTYRRSSEGRMVAVLLPGAVEAQRKILEEWMSLVENGEANDVDPLVRYIIQLQQSEFLRGGRRAG